MKSAALAAGEGSDRTTYLGRWKAEASDEYTRTSRQIITEIQNTVAAKAASRPDFLDESDTLGDLGASLEESGIPEDRVAEQIAKLKVQRQGYNAEAPFNVFQDQLPIAETQPEQEDEECKVYMQQPTTDDEPEETQSLMEDYWVSVGKRGGKLHVTGGCPSFPGQNVKNYEWAAAPSEVKWASLCKKCWKGVPGPELQGSSADQDAGGTSTSSSSSSFSSSEGGNGI